MENHAEKILLEHYPGIGEDLDSRQINTILAAMYEYGNNIASVHITELIDANPDTQLSKQAIEWMRDRIIGLD